MNLANALTLFRISLIPFLLGVLLVPDVKPGRELWASAIMVVAGITDWLDGYFARRRRQVTTLGTLLDPVADKLLISAAFLALVELHVVRAWMAFVIIGREFAVSGLRSIASLEGLTIKASVVAKAKMVSQVVAVILILLGIRYPVLSPLGTFALWAVLLFAVASGFEYFHRFWNQVDARFAKRVAGGESAKEVFDRRKTDAAIR